MRPLSRVARRYVEALLDAAAEGGILDDVGRDLEFTASLVAEPSVGAFLVDPTVDRASKMRFFVEWVAPHVSPLFRNFLGLLVRRRREDLLDRLDEAFRQTRERREGIVRGRLESGRPLAEEDRRVLEEAASRALGLRVSLEVAVRPDLIGGVRLEVGGRLLDASVAGRLAAARERLLSVPLN